MDTPDGPAVVIVLIVERDLAGTTTTTSTSQSATDTPAQNELIHRADRRAQHDTRAVISPWVWRGLGVVQRLTFGALRHWAAELLPWFN